MTGKKGKEKVTAVAAERTAEVESIDGIIKVLYEVISFRQGGKPDWDRFRGLFAPGARLIPAKKAGAQVLTPDDFIALFMRNIESGSLREFQEKEIARRTMLYGNIAHLFSTYESRFSAGAADPDARGINSIQLLHEKGRWWVMTIFWADEREFGPIPRRYMR
jgi:heme-degrading monooxygenase HmoA